ncbi:Interleukin-17 receptor A [Collichthys lucidus]|uniref:Interleukin-17 receptor A n=1 Tax=Collichthys lucidus TaxID=240159 RepID=A0A4U5VSE2_COLLU|nr:Interleukin-17 receptor A [Collichthys lucidus]
MILSGALVLLVSVSLSSTVRVLTSPPLNCTRQALTCKVTHSNCMDSKWLDASKYTPSSPEDLLLFVGTRQDDRGHLQPVLLANWTIKDDGSISYLKATELHVLVMSTNQNLCVRYSFKDTLPMRSPSGDKWSFSADMLVLDPGERYRVSVFNIPKPELGHSYYDVSHEVLVPDCQDPTMQRTQFCIERGSLWQPNITVSNISVNTRAALCVSFSPDTHCVEYLVIVQCSRIPQVQRIYKTNQRTLNATFILDKWPRHCCQFDVEIKPIFPRCDQDCVRRKRTLNVCPAVVLVEGPNVRLYLFAILGAVLCAVMAVIMYVICRKPGKPDVTPAPMGGDEIQHKEKLKQPPKVLVIYSQDHHIYRDIVLKLCAFLQAKCGTKVLVDLLDSTSVGMVGRLRWLEWQRQQLKNPMDKILVLCSRGVQAKWRAMCGQGRVTLREDILSPTDDMLTPFLNLFLPDMHQAGMLGKYMVAYFDDISSEQDVPSVFDIAVKYKLMKHFEELYFRLLDIEKYQPGQVSHIEGIGGDEYFKCPSGQALKNAIKTFQVYQLENPDWFEKECVDSEEEVITEASALIDHLQIPPVLECVPVIRDGLPVYTQGVEIHENGNSIHVLTPELNTEREISSVAEITPVVNPGYKHEYPLNLDEVLADDMYPYSPTPQSVYICEPVLYKPPSARQNWLSLKIEPLAQLPTEDKEEDSLLPMSQLFTHSDPRGLAPHNSINSNPPESSSASMQSEYLPSSEINHSQPVEMEEYEVLELSGKGQSSGSDQGYISKMSTQPECPLKEDPLVALRRLQEELFERNLRYCDMDPEAN